MIKNVQITTDRILEIDKEFLFELESKFNFNPNNPLYLVMLTERKKRVGFDQKIIITDNHFVIDAKELVIDVVLDLKRVNNDLIKPDIIYKMFE